MKSSEDYVKEMKEMIILTWSSVILLIAISITWLYYGGKTGPWVILAFAIFQNIPMAIGYMVRYNRSKLMVELVEEHENPRKNNFET